MSSPGFPPKYLTAFLLLMVFVLALTVPASSPRVASAQQPDSNLTVLAGFEDTAADGLEVQAFLPQDIIVREGDTITWNFTSLEPHTVTFLSGGEPPQEVISLPSGGLAYNPEAVYPTGGPEYDGSGLVNSGVVIFDNQAGQGLTYSLTLTQAGTYQYVCLIHPAMTGTVTVLSSEAINPFGQDFWDIVAESERVSFTNAVQAQKPGPTEVKTNPVGAREFTLITGISAENSDLMHFHEPEITISTGDTVTWSWSSSSAGHTVSFVPDGQPVPEFLVPEPREQGQPLLIFNPEVVSPAGGDIFTGVGFLSSGIRFNPSLVPPGSLGNYSLTFTQPGTYDYVCLIHGPQGMQGTLTVTGEPITIAQQSTDTTDVVLPSVGGTPRTGLFGALAGVLGLGLFLAGALLIRRRIGA